MKSLLRSLSMLACAAAVSQQAAAVVVPVTEDVMTSSFFSLDEDWVRGYPGDNRPTFRVSTDNPFGTTGAETIYLKFDPAAFSSFSGPVNAILTLQSISGGFGADAGPGNPFTVSAHAVSVDPFTSIIDNTNPGGTISWIDFYNDNILAADAAAHTVVDGFGAVTFNVSGIVNGWVSGSTTVFAIALTGKNDFSGNDFLHGFRNNTEALGSTFLTVTAVPEPETYALLLAGLGVVAWGVRRKAAATQREMP